MQFGIASWTGPGIGQVVEFGDRSTGDPRILIRDQIVAKKFCAAVTIVAKQSTTGCHDVTTPSRGASAETPRIAVLPDKDQNIVVKTDHMTTQTQKQI